MSDFQITDHILWKECKSLANEIFAEVMADAAEDEDAEYHRETMMDRAREAADGHQWTIYNYQALMLCAHCDTNYGEDFLSDIGTPSEPDIYKLACIIAYGEILGRIGEELDTLIDQHETEDA
jgi:hypothetical protein